MSSRAVMHFCSPHEKHSSPWDVRLAIFWALLSPAQLPQVSCLSMGQNFVFKNCWMEQNIIKQNKVVKVAGCHCTRHNAIATIATYTVDQQLQNIVEGMLKHILCEQPWNQSQTNNQIWLQNWLLCTVGHWWYAQWHGKKTNNILTSKVFFYVYWLFFTSLPECLSSNFEPFLSKYFACDYLINSSLHKTQQNIYYFLLIFGKVMWCMIATNKG